MSADQPGKAELAVLLGHALGRARRIRTLTQTQAAELLTFKIRTVQSDEQGGDQGGRRGVTAARAGEYEQVYQVGALELLAWALEHGKALRRAMAALAGIRLDQHAQVLTTAGRSVDGRQQATVLAKLAARALNVEDVRIWAKTGKWRS